MEKTSPNYRLSANEFAARFGAQGATARRSLCVNGHYMGAIPIKLPNNRLRWPDLSIEEIVTQDKGVTQAQQGGQV